LTGRPELRQIRWATFTWLTQATTASKVDRYGNFLLSWGGAGTGPGRFGEPSGLAIDSLGNIYVTDKENNDIQKFSLYGSHNRIIVPDRITERVAGWSQGELHRNDFLLALKFMAGQGVINTGGTAPGRASPAFQPG